MAKIPETPEATAVTVKIPTLPQMAETPITPAEARTRAES